MEGSIKARQCGQLTTCFPPRSPRLSELSRIQTVDRHCEWKAIQAWRGARPRFAVSWANLSLPSGRSGRLLTRPASGPPTQAYAWRIWPWARQAQSHHDRSSPASCWSAAGWQSAHSCHSPWARFDWNRAGSTDWPGRSQLCCRELAAVDSCWLCALKLDCWTE